MMNTIKCQIVTNIKLILPIIFMLSTPVAFSNTDVIGLTINVSSLDDIKKIYKIDKRGNVTYNLNIEQIPIDGVKDAFFGMDNGKLKVVGMKFKDDKFDYLLNILKDKYHLVSSEKNKFNDRYAIFKNDDDLIILNAPFGSFDLELTYVEEKYNKRVEENSKGKFKSVLLNDKNNL